MRKETRRRSRGASSPLDEEAGTIRRGGGAWVALGYPARYAVGASSLGFQEVYRRWNGIPALSCARFFDEPRSSGGRSIRALENEETISRARAIAFSVACETDLLGVVRLLVAAGLEPLARDRGDRDPPVIVGGPLTFVDPSLVAPLADAVVCGEAEESLGELGEALARTSSLSDLDACLTPRPPGLWLPGRDPAPPRHAVAPEDALPARAATWSPRAELRDLFLVEVARGCDRACRFCVLSRKARSGSRFRPVPVERVMEAIPRDAPGVGLVGAAVTDHPDIEEIAGRVAASGRRVSLSSVRADRLTPGLARALKRGRLRTITTAADGASDRLRRAVLKGISSDDLARAVEIAADAGVRSVKLYTLVGLPGEEDGDVEELARLVRGLDARSKITIAAQAFVPKPGTPLEGAPMADVDVVRRRLRTLARSVEPRARVSPSSPRRSWLDWKLAHAGERAALAAVRALDLGGTFGAWRRALEELGLDRGR